MEGLLSHPKNVFKDWSYINLKIIKHHKIFQLKKNSWKYRTYLPREKNIVPLQAKHIPIFLLFPREGVGSPQGCLELPLQGRSLTNRDPKRPRLLPNRTP